MNTRVRTEAGLRNSLANPNAAEADEAKNADDADKEGATDEKSKEPKGEEARKLTTARQDYQLNYAINLLRGLAIARNGD